MARITKTYGDKMLRLDKWLGLNENPDGDTHLEIGESPEMRNFRVTRDNHLQLRPGYHPMIKLGDSPIRGMWTGYVDGQEVNLAACDGHIWKIDPVNWEKEDLGELTDDGTQFFGFSKKVYILNGHEFYAWDGTGQIVPVEGYIPIVAISTPPAGGGALLEPVNKLTGKKRQKFSPNGSATTFQLAEQSIDEIISVETDLGASVSYTVNLATGIVTVSPARPQGVNTLVITWRKGNGDRGSVTGKRFYEFYNGANDTRVFLYGDGTNEAIYSDLDELGLGTAEYFPDLNVMHVDSANTPITAMIRHYDRLLTFKSNGVFSSYYSAITLPDGTTTAGFFTSAVNREIGNIALGQVRLVENSPRSIFGRSVFEWGLASGSVRDERNNKRISDRVESSLAGMSLRDAVCFDHEQHREFYLVSDGIALVHNYENDTWYRYTNFPAVAMDKYQDEVYFGTESGEIMHLSRLYRDDNGAPIDAYWESGSMDFGASYLKKTTTDIWVTLKPESHSRVTVTAQTNNRSIYVERMLSLGLATFSEANFAQWSFGTNRKPQSNRRHIRVRRFEFYKLVFKSKDTAATTTILSTDIQVRFGGKVQRGG